MQRIHLLLLISFIIISACYAKAFSYENFTGNKYNLRDVSEAKEITKKNNILSSDKEILIIFDYSKSMNNSIGYTKRFFLATDAIISVITTIDDNTKIGLRLFGIDNSSDFAFQNKQLSDEEKRCLSSKLVLPIAKNNTRNIINKFSEYTPFGASPIGYSLRQAVKNDFTPAVQLKHIILVTDGTENCGDDPCKFIRNLMQTRNDIKIDIIGVSINKNAYSELSCIAGYTNGKLYNANNPDELKINLKNALEINYPDKKPEQKSNPEIKKQSSGIIFKNYSYEFLN